MTKRLGRYLLTSVKNKAGLTDTDYDPTSRLK